MSAATDGAASLRTSSPSDVTLDSYRHPDWAVTVGPGDYVHALVTRALPLEIHARIGPPGQPGSEVVLLPADWQWTGQRYGDALAKPGDIHLCPPHRDY